MRRFLIIALLLATARAHSQTPDDSTLRVASRLVVVPALVQGPRNNVVYSLRTEDFQLIDRGITQKLTLDEAKDQPLSLVVLMQTGGAAAREFDKYSGLETMLADILGGAPNQVAVVDFDSQPEAASPFTSDIAQWTDAINHPDPGNSGAAIRDALKFGLNLLAKQPANHRKVILLISQPQDSGSTTSAEEISRIIGETDTTIYAVVFTPQITRLKGALKDPPGPHPPITVPGGTFIAYFDLTEPLHMVLDAMKKDVTSEIATLSGGESLHFSDKNQLDDMVAIVGTHLINRYMLSFSPSKPTPGFHPIKLGLLNHPELAVTARTGYWLSSTSSDSMSKPSR